MGKKVSKRQKTNTKKLQISRGLKFIGGFFGIVAIGYLVYFASWIPQYIEVGKMAEDPMASKSLLGMKLKSSHEDHAIPALRSFLGKPRSAAVSDDGDEFPRQIDNCPDIANQSQEDYDEDGIGDACDEYPGFLHLYMNRGEEQVESTDTKADPPRYVTPLPKPESRPVPIAARSYGGSQAGPEDRGPIDSGDKLSSRESNSNTKSEPNLAGQEVQKDEAAGSGELSVWHFVVTGSVVSIIVGGVIWWRHNSKAL